MDASTWRPRRPARGPTVVHGIYLTVGSGLTQTTWPLLVDDAVHGPGRRQRTRLTGRIASPASTAQTPATA